MKILADANIPALATTFGLHGDVRVAEGRSITRAMLADIDVLLVRSVTRVGESLLKGTPVKFVGTATIGQDHLDCHWLDTQGISWASAPGCNADAAAQYTLSMLVLACERLRRPVQDQKVGIIGHGNVGSRLHQLLQVMGVEVAACDPPLAALGHTGMVSLEQALVCPVISLHVPLVTDGPYPTRHLISPDMLSALTPGSLLINTSRGDVIDPDTFQPTPASRQLAWAFDVWPGEPDISRNLVRQSAVATPHVAGYSVEGKLNGTRMIFEAWQRWAGLPAEPQMAASAVPRQRYHASREQSIEQIIIAITGVRDDDELLRDIASSESPRLGPAFDKSRKTYRLRHDFANWEINGVSQALENHLSKLGFGIVA